MGAVQKLATVVMIGLVALATVTLVYIANEPNRRDDEVTRQDDLAIERGTDLYITYCLQCHGPTGQGAAEKIGGQSTGRKGGIINQADSDTEGLPVVYQSDDPSAQSKAEDFLRYRISNGAPGDPRLPVVMPAFGPELNVEEMNDLIYMIMNVDWDYVYNTSLIETGEKEKEQVCIGTPTDPICSEEEPVVWPTVPPTPEPTAEGATPAPSGDATPVAGGDEGTTGAATLELDASDPANWSTKTLSVKPGDTITVKNVGALPHDFSVDALGINEALNPGASVTVTIPADAKPGDYEFFCNVPGHKEAGMVGTLTITAP